jgi:hypothetical protein
MKVWPLDQVRRRYGRHNRMVEVKDPAEAGELMTSPESASWLVGCPLGVTGWTSLTHPEPRKIGYRPIWLICKTSLIQ